MKWNRVPAFGTPSRSHGAARTAALAMLLGSVEEARLELTLNGTTLAAALVIEGAESLIAARAVDLRGAKALALEMGAILDRASRWGDVDQGSRELLRQRGELLFDTLLPAPIKAALRTIGKPVAAVTSGSEGRGERAGTRLVLVLDEALLGLPWELMHSGDAFIGLEYAVGRITRGLQAETTVGAAPGRSRRTLVVCDPRGDLIGSYYEGLALRDELAQGDERVEVDLRSSEVSLAEVRRLLREYDVVHFAGHAEHGDGNERGWWLRDGVLGPGAIRELAGGRRFPRLVFSNACRSAGDGSAIGGGGATGLAAAFLEAGVEHYVGTVQDVPDEPASLFALTFYAHLRSRPAAGIGEAMRAARMALAGRYGPTSVYWASWVLYGAPTSAGLTNAADIAGGAGAELADGRLAEAAVTRREGPRAGYAFNEAGARVRGAGVVGLVPDGVPAAELGWGPTARGAAVALATVGLVWLLVVLAELLGRTPPVAWVPGRALARAVVPANDGDPGERIAPVMSGVMSARLEIVRAAEGAVAATDGAGPGTRLRFTVPEAGVVAIWAIGDRGAIERIDVAAGPLSPVQAGWVVEVPAAALEEPRAVGPSAIYLAWRQVPPSAPQAFEAELDHEVKAARAALQDIEAAAREGHLAAGNVSRERIEARFEEALDDRFDTVTRLVLAGPR